MGTWREGTTVALWYGGVRTHLRSPDLRTLNKEINPSLPAARFGRALKALARSLVQYLGMAEPP